MFKVSPASLQTFSDTSNFVLGDCVQYSTVHILNLFCNGHLQIISCVGIVSTVHILNVFCDGHLQIIICVGIVRIY